MKTIYPLPPHIISQIAAGEVIERPVYAVKELLENAIDAGATDIAVFVEEYGLKKIQVIDNGRGMEKEDVTEAWKLHTTSKLLPEDVLIGIKSFGFRGEALASLAAVSRLTIKSRVKGEAIGTQAEIAQGKLERVTSVGMPEGTTIIAEDLYGSTPVRKKFLRSKQTELRHITELVAEYSLAYPTIRFFLKHNKKTLLDVYPATTSTERIQDFFGNEIFQQFLSLSKDESYLSLRGWIGKPPLTATTQSKQYIFINNRRVDDKMISLAVKEAFATMLEPTRFPVFVLFLTLPYEMVDVNIHPRKENVAFLNSQFIFQTIKQAVEELLSANNLTFQNLSWQRSGVGTTKSFAGNLLKKTVLKDALLTHKDASPIQFYRLYIAIETPEGITLIDQHAAHERILFEKLQQEFRQQTSKKNTFPLPQPLRLSLSSSQQLLLEEHKEVLHQLGFAFSSEKRALLVTHVPFLFQDRNISQLLQEILERLSEGLPLKDVDRISEEMLAFLACRAAVKAGDTLSPSEMQQIITELHRTHHNATCPHGRPTHYLVERTYIDSLFKR